MKNALMRAPAITEIYNQKLTYENHLRKLTQIRQDRKHQLQIDHSRQQQLTHIKQSKSKSFAHKFNEHSMQINQSNVKFLNKLQKVKPFTRHTSYTSTERVTRQPMIVNPTAKRRMAQTEKQNSRLFFRMKSVSSTLSKDRMMNDYAKAQRIKQRITKYANANNKIALKSQKYFSHNNNKSFVSNRSSQNGSTDRLKMNLVNHYKKEDIIKNRISDTEHRIFKQKRHNRPLPSLGQNQVDIQDNTNQQLQDKNGFFATQPQKNKRAISTTRGRG